MRELADLAQHAECYGAGVLPRPRSAKTRYKSGPDRPNGRTKPHHHGSPWLRASRDGGEQAVNGGISAAIGGRRNGKISDRRDARSFWHQNVWHDARVGEHAHGRSEQPRIGVRRQFHQQTWMADHAMTVSARNHAAIPLSLPRRQAPPTTRPSGRRSFPHRPA